MQNPPWEFELKFKARASDLAAMKKAVDAHGGGRSAWSTSDLHAIYYDTPDHRLSSKGVAFRVRQSGDEYVQTIKSDTHDGGAALHRNEWEYPVAKQEPDLSLVEPETRRAMGTVLPDELEPAVTVDVKRQKKRILQMNAFGPDLEVEAAIDKGTVHAAGKSVRISECELELIRGEPAAFFEMALAVQGNTSARLSNVSKAATGFALFDDKKPGAVKVPKFLLEHDQTVSDALRNIFGTCVENIVDNEPVAIDGTDIEGVHQLRVSVRRMRSTLSIVKKLVDPERVGWLREELKWLHTSMGPARDWDVFISETLAVVDGYGIDLDSIDALRRLVEVRRKEAYELVRETLNSTRYAQLILRLTGFFETEGWLPRPVTGYHPLIKPLREHAAYLLSRPYRKLLKEGENLAEMEMEDRHVVRIRLKKLRYAVDFLENLYPGDETRKFLKNLRKLQDQFGYLNDVAQIRHMIAELFEYHDGKIDDEVRLRGATGLVMGWHAQHLHMLESHFLEYWTDFITTPTFWKKGR